MNTVESLLRARATAPGPLFTFYDDLTGERIELSGVSTANWVAKTANLLRDGFGLDQNARVRLLLPAHWQTAVWVLGVWAVGAQICDDDDADVAVSSLDLIDQTSTADERIALSLAPMGARISEPLPAGVLDYAREVPGYGDRFTAVPFDPQSVAWSIGSSVRTHTGVVELAGDLIEQRQWPTGARRLVEADDFDLGWVTSAVVAPLVGNGSTVLVRHADPAKTHAKRRDERTLDS